MISDKAQVLLGSFAVLAAFGAMLLIMQHVYAATTSQTPRVRSCILAHQVAQGRSPDGTPQVTLNIIAKADSTPEGKIPIPDYPLVTVCTMFQPQQLQPGEPQS